MTDREYNRLRSRQRYKNNPEQVRAYNRKYYAAHREEIAAKRKAKRQEKETHRLTKEATYTAKVTMTDMEVLKFYLATQLEIKTIGDQLRRGGSTGAPGQLGAQRYDRIGGSTNDRTAASMQAQDGLEDALRRKLRELQEVETRFNAIIESVYDPLLRVILRRYYGLGETDEQIAVVIGKSSKRTNQLRNDAIRMVSAA